MIGMTQDTNSLLHATSPIEKLQLILPKKSSIQSSGICYVNYINNNRAQRKNGQ